MPNNCYNCKHFEYGIDLPFVGECHRYPPTQTPQHTPKVGQSEHWGYPKIETPTYCSEWKHAAGRDN